MKKLFFVLLVLIGVCAASVPATAATAKAPKNICFVAQGSLFAFSMATKKGITATLSEKVTFYDIQGTLSSLGLTSWPLSGTGYMYGDTFVFNLNSNGYVTVAMYGKWNVVSETGEVNIIQTNSTNSVTEQECTLQLYDCNVFPVSAPN